LGVKGGWVCVWGERVRPGFPACPCLSLSVCFSFSHSRSLALSLSPRCFCRRLSKNVSFSSSSAPPHLCPPGLKLIDIFCCFLDQFCANVKTTAVGESDDVEKSRSTTSFFTTEKITKRLLEGWSLARETCSECEMPMMRRNARRGDARWMDEVVCVECVDRDDEPRERFGRRRPGKRLALMEGKPRSPVGTKSFAKLYRGSSYSGENQEELSPTSVL
jgi:hypothetical protein